MTDPKRYDKKIKNAIIIVEKNTIGFIAKTIISKIAKTIPITSAPTPVAKRYRAKPSYPSYISRTHLNNFIRGFL